jgi:hypothetical protein
MDHVKCRYADEDELTDAHDQCNQAYIIKANRQYVTNLHDAVYPKGSKPTKSATKLEGLLHGPLVTKVLQGTAMGDEGRWDTGDTSHFYPDTCNTFIFSEGTVAGFFERA